MSVLNPLSLVLFTTFAVMAGLSALKLRRVSGLLLVDRLCWYWSLLTFLVVVTASFVVLLVVVIAASLVVVIALVVVAKSLGLCLYGHRPELFRPLGKGRGNSGGGGAVSCCRRLLLQ